MCICVYMYMLNLISDNTPGPNGIDTSDSVISYVTSTMITSSELVGTYNRNNTITSDNDRLQPLAKLPYTCDELEAISTTSFFSAGGGARICAVYEAYIAANLTFPIDQYYGVYPSDEHMQGTSLLLLNGNLDFNTPYPLAARYETAIQHTTYDHRMIEVPYAAHTTFTSAQLLPNLDSTGLVTCGEMLVASYVLNNGDTSKVDTTCLSQLLPLDWSAVYEPTQDSAYGMFNSASLWD